MWKSRDPEDKMTCSGWQRLFREKPVLETMFFWFPLYYNMLLHWTQPLLQRSVSFFFYLLLFWRISFSFFQEMSLCREGNNCIWRITLNRTNPRREQPWALSRDHSLWQLPQGHRSAWTSFKCKCMSPWCTVSLVSVYHGVEGVSSMDGAHPFSSPDTVPFPQTRHICAIIILSRLACSLQSSSAARGRVSRHFVERSVRGHALRNNERDVELRLCTSLLSALFSVSC